MKRLKIEKRSEMLADGAQHDNAHTYLLNKDEDVKSRPDVRTGPLVRLELARLVQALPPPEQEAAGVCK